MENPHREHRQRVKERFLAEGLDGFPDHNALELLLYYAIPQKDTNELAHALIAKFGTLSAVFDASVDELCSVEGVSRHTAVLLSLIPQLSRRYFSAAETKSEPYDNADKLGRLFVMKYVGETREVVYLTMLDNAMHIIDTVKLFTGSVNSAHITPRTVIEPCLRRNAAMVVLAHNHPAGLPVPSAEDLSTTHELKEALAAVGIPLLEHYLVASNCYAPLLYCSGASVRQTASSGNFYAGIDRSRFYSSFSSAEPKIHDVK